MLAPEDAAPPLDWEFAIWWLYLRMRTQWRHGPRGRTGLDYAPATAIIRELNWPLTVALELLQAVELVVLDVDHERRQSNQG